MRSARLLLTAVMTFLLAVSVLVAAPAEAQDVLTNADIVKMAKAGISEDIILRDIEMSKTKFGTSPAALIELKNQGVSDRILGAVLDSRNGGSRSKSEGLATSRVAQAAAPGHHGLPSFDADVQIDSKTHDKVSMGHNQIRVEHGGVPVFSVKWKDNSSANAGK